MPRVRVFLVYLGHAPPVHLAKFAAKLNRLQHAIDFRTLSDSTPAGIVPPFALDDVRACEAPPFYTDGAILDRLEHVLKDHPEVRPQDHVVVVTNARITRGHDAVMEPADAGDYLGLWAPEGVDTTRRRGIVSLALYLDRYCERALRTVEQYIVFMLVAYIGDTTFDSQFTHRDFRFCVFDYNDDLDSIVGSIRRAGLCKPCQAQLAAVAAPGGEVSMGAAFADLLRYVHRPRPFVIWGRLQRDALFSLVILGLALGFVWDTLSQLLQIQQYVWIGAFFLFILLAGSWVFKQHVKPGPTFT